MSYMEDCKAVAIAQNSPEWLEWRNAGIGGSEIAAIVGASKWATALSVWAKKTGIDKSQVEENGNMEWGHRLEAAITDKWLDEHKDYALEIRGPVFERIDKPWMRASLDNIVTNPDGEFEALECKTAGSDADWYDPVGAECVPEAYMWQAFWQMAVTGIRKVHFSVLVMGRERTWLDRTLEWDDKYIDYAIAKGGQFWELVESATPPSLSEENPEADANALKAIFPKVEENLAVELGNDGEAELDTLVALVAQLDATEKQIEAKKNWFKARMGNTQYCSANGRKVCTASSSIRESIDSKALKAAHPEIAKQFAKSTPVKTYRFAV